MLFAPYSCGFKASNVGHCLYKIYDDSIRIRQFLGVDNEDKIKVILSDHEGHFLHEFIDGDEPLHSFIDFNLPVEILNAITPKLSGSQAQNLLCYVFKNVYLEIYPK